MASIDENQRQWTDYAWDQAGDEWSQAWGGTPYLWQAVVYPRVMTWLPAGTGLEIAPGHGRFTQFLHRLCERLVIVDLTDGCIEACRRRFDGVDHIEYHVNDGRSLDFVADGTIDFVFSFDSLVHAESDVLQAYVGELGRVLSADGVGFIHHSNMGAFRDPASGQLTCDNPHWRAESMSAERFREYCGEHGLSCIGQELINWGVPAPLTDALSLFTRRGSRFDRPPVALENPDFMDQAAAIQRIAKLYGPRPVPALGEER